MAERRDLPTIFFRQPRYLALLIVVVLVAGLSALATIGRQEDPTITNLFATIVTPYPGATAERVEAMVTEKIESELIEIEQIDGLASESRAGISIVQIELDARVTDTEIDQVWVDVRSALDDAEGEFPAGVPSPTLETDRGNAFTSISAITWRGEESPNLAIMGRFAEELQDRLRAVPGTELVAIWGAPDEEIVVEIDRNVLASLALTPDDIATAIAAADAKVAAGQVRAENNLVIEVAGEIESLNRIRDVPIVANSDTIVRVGDVATVSRTIAQPAEDLAFLELEPAVVIAARMAPNLQVDTWMQAIEEEFAEFEASLPGGLGHRQIFDQSVYTAQRFDSLGENLAIGVGLVVIVLFFTLGWRSALIVAFVLPVTGLMAIALLQAFGVPLHQMSVTGLIVALGLIVDSAIVMTDRIRSRLENGAKPVEAMGEAVRHLWLPLLASTVTTVLAFMPMVLLPGAPGDFVSTIAIAVIAALASSWLLAITVTPAITGFALARLGKSQRKWWRNGISGHGLGRVFRRSLELSLRYRTLSILIALALPIIGFASLPTLTAQFFPGADRDQFYVQMRLPAGASVDQTVATMQQAHAILREDEAIDTVAWFVGRSAPAFYYNMLMNQDGVARFAEALVTAETPEAALAIMPPLQDRFDAELPGAQIIVREILQGPPVVAPVELRIFGPDLERLRDLGEEARLLMTQIPEITHTRSSITGGAPQLQFDADEDSARLLGLTLGDVARQLEANLEGVVGGSLIEQTNELPVRVRVSAAERGSITDVGSIDILTALTSENADTFPGVPLSALGSLSMVPSEPSVPHFDGQRVNRIYGYVDAGVLPQEAFAAFERLLAESPLALPVGYTLEFGGDTDARAETVRDLMGSVALIVTLTLVTIVLTFNSFRLSLVVGAAAALSLGLSILSLALLNFPFGIHALIGAIGSIGVSVNVAIIILTELKANRDAVAGDPGAIRDVVMDTSRHIVSTTLTTFGGFLPLVLGGGGLWPPFATAIAGGVLLSSIVSFYFVPPMFSIITRSRPVAVFDEPTQEEPTVKEEPAQKQKASVSPLPTARRSRTIGWLPKAG
ncbi:MAG: efflux RND transporter permease subunit [Pseudomonadota bacterium]